MTGTSLDGLDAALVEIAGTGLDMTARFVGLVSQPLGTLAETLRAMAEGEPHEPIAYLRAGRQLGELYAEAVASLCAAYLPDRVKLDLVAAHGQTIWHAPGEHLSWQLFDPWPIVRRLSVPVVYDLRQADLIAGGEGAPITPIADWVLYGHRECSRLVVNLGGIANATRLPLDAGVEQVTGSDICPCNLLIDGITRCRFPELAFDEGGRIAAQGRPHGAIYAEIGHRPLTGRSGGREEFNEDWLRWVDEQVVGDFSNVDAVAAAVEAVAMWLADAIEQASVNEVILAGGGARNPVLVERIRQRCAVGIMCRLSDELGIPCEAREAAGFAVLGALSQDGVPITLEAVTGARQPGRAGAWAYP